MFVKNQDKVEFLKNYEIFRSFHDDHYRLFEKYVCGNPLLAFKYACSILGHSI